MQMVRNLLLLLHFLGMAGILFSLVSSRTKISSGVTHSAALALITGIALVGVRYSLHSEDPMKWPLFDYVKIGVKLGFVLIILALGYQSRKKELTVSHFWLVITGLTIANIVIAAVG